jgi:hypothetical protein
MDTEMCKQGLRRDSILAPTCCANPDLVGWIIDKEIHIISSIRFRVRINERNIGILRNKKKKKKKKKNKKKMGYYKTATPTATRRQRRKRSNYVFAVDLYEVIPRATPPTNQEARKANAGRMADGL